MSALANILCALIALIFGLFFGNFCTSFYYRIANNLPILGIAKLGGKPPHCSLCKHHLRFVEYLPIFNWFSIKDNKCNYCGMPIDNLYHFFELGQGVLALIAYLAVGFSMEYIFITLFSALILLATVLSYKKVIVPVYLRVAMGALGFIYDVVYIDEVFSHIVAAIAMVTFIPQIVLKDAERKHNKDILSLQNDIISLSAISIIWVPWYVYVPLFVGTYCLCKQKDELFLYIYPMVLLPTWIFVIL